MIATTDLATIEDLALARGVDPDPTDIRAIRTLAAASDAVRAYLGYDPAFRAGADVVVDGSGVSRQNLPLRGLLAVASITSDAGTAWEYVWTTDRYGWDHAGVLYARTYGDFFPAGNGNITARVDYGYRLPGDPPAVYGLDDTPVPRLPDAIREATVAIAETFYTLEGVTGVVTSETIGTYSYAAGGTTSESGSEAAYRRLAPYRANDVA